MLFRSLGPDLMLSEFKPPESFLGRSFIQLELPKRFGVTVVAVRREKEKKVILPKADDEIQEGDTLLTVSKPGAVNILLGKA